MDEHVTEELSAYLDDRLGAEERERVSALLASSGEARAELDRIAAGREFMRAGATAPSAAEAAVLDAAVLRAGTTAPVPVRAADRTRPSPRKRGRAPWPYFAAAAAFAVVLSLGIVVLAQVFGRGSAHDTAAVTTATTVAGPEAATAPGPAPTQAPPTAAAVPRDSAGPQVEGGLPYYPAAPELYLSGIVVDDVAGLSGLAVSNPEPVGSREAAISALVDLASAAGLDGTEVARCLDAAGPGVPVRVDVGTYAGTPAYIVRSAQPAAPSVAVVALARGTCATLATATAPG